LIRCFANMYAKLLINACRATGAAATASVVEIPFGQRAPTTMLGAHLHAFVLLYSSRLLIVLYSPNGVKVRTNTNGLQKPEAYDIPSGKKEYKRSTHEYKGVQTEYKTPREITSRAVQTDYTLSTNGVQKNTSKYKRLAMFRNDFQASTVNWKPTGQSVFNYCRR